MPGASDLHRRLGAEARVSDALAEALVEEIALRPSTQWEAAIQDTVQQYRRHLEARRWYWREIDLHLLQLETNLNTLLRRRTWRTWKGNPAMPQ